MEVDVNVLTLVDVSMKPNATSLKSVKVIGQQSNEGHVVEAGKNLAFKFSEGNKSRAGEVKNKISTPISNMVAALDDDERTLIVLRKLKSLWV